MTKQYECVQLKHHREVASTIVEYEKRGWRLHTYQAAGDAGSGGVNHYLLFVKGE
jgi:hypothetical protein